MAIDPRTPARPGTYTYRQQGYASVGGVETPAPPTGTLVVDPATPQGTQVWRRFILDDDPGSDVLQRWTADGVYLVSGTQRQSLFGNVLEIACRFTPPVLVVPWAIEKGWTTRGSCDCGTFTPTVELTVGETRTVQVVGRSVEVHQVTSTLRSEGTVRGVAQQEDWVSWELGTIYTHQHVHLEMEVGGVTIVDELTSELAGVPLDGEDGGDGEGGGAHR
jgi:hypothetical protein